MSQALEQSAEQDYVTVKTVICIIRTRFKSSDVKLTCPGSSVLALFFSLLLLFLVPAMALLSLTDLLTGLVVGVGDHHTVISVPVASGLGSTVAEKLNTDAHPVV